MHHRVIIIIMMLHHVHDLGVIVIVGVVVDHVHA
jgi:hypothetical protein